MIFVHYFLSFSSAAEKQDSEQMALRTAEKLLKVISWFTVLFKAIFSNRNKAKIQEKFTEQKLSDNDLRR